jgi:hypothetical protein
MQSNSTYNKASQTLNKSLMQPSVVANTPLVFNSIKPGKFYFMTTLLRYVKTISMVVLLISTAFIASAQPTITVDNTSFSSCTGSVVTITFSTVNGSGQSQKYLTVQDAANAGQVASTFTPIFTSTAVGGAVYTSTTSFQISDPNFHFATGSGGPTATTTGVTYGITIPSNLPSGTYYLGLSSINPTFTPTVTTSTQVTVTAVVIASISYNGNPFCPVGSVSPTITNAGGNGSFSSTAGLVIDAPTGTINLATSTPGTYTVTYSYSSGACTVSASTTSVTINPLPTITGTTSVCVGSTTQLTGSATAATTTPWSSSNTSVATVTSTGLVTGVSAGTSVISYTNTNGCTATTTVTVNALPTAGITNNAGTTILTCSVTSIGVTATGGVTYAWSGGLGTSATASITLPGTYTVTVTDANGCSSQASITITQNTTPPGASIAAGTMTLTCTTPSTTLTATGNGTFLWSTTATTAAINITTGGTYTVTVTGANGCTSVAAVIIAVNQTPPGASIVASTMTLTCSTPSANLTASGNGTFAWSTGATTAAISVSTAGTYTVTITGANGCISAAAVTIAVDQTPPGATISSSPNTSVLTCTTPSIALTAAGNGTFSWSTGANTASINATIAGTYTVTVTGANGCTSVAAVTITANQTAPGASISAGTMTLTCTTPSTTLTASGNGTFAWSTGATTAAINVSAGGTYTVTVTGANGCTSVAAVTLAVNQTPPGATISSAPNTSVLTCTNPSIALTASGNGTFAWSTGATTATINVTTAGTYIVTVTGANGCTSVATVTITADQTPPGATITNNTGTTVLTCSTTAISVTASGNGTFAWSGGLGTSATASIVSPGTYTVTVTGTNGCTSVAGITITQNIGGTAPTLTSSAANNTICTGTSVTFTATAGLTNYQFFLNGASVQNGASNSYTSSTLNNNDAVFVTATFSNGCTASSNTINTTVNSVGTITLSSAAGTNAQATCQATAINNITYAVGGSSTGATVSGLPAGVSSSFSGGVLTISGTPTVSGTFNYTVTTSGSPCVNPTATGTITVAAPLTVSSSASGTSNVTTCVNVAMAPIVITGVNGSYTLTPSLPAGVTANLSGSTLTLSGTPSAVGNYALTISTTGACSANTLAVDINVAQCAVIAGVGAINPTCPGGSNGAINVTIQSGGLAPYQISINAGQTFVPYTVTPGVNTFSNLPAGIYPVYVKSANGAVDFIAFVTLLAPPAITASVSAGTINCNNGTTTLSVTNIAGGNGAPYLVSVDGGAYTSATTYTVGAGNHSVSIQDSKGCTQTVGSVNIANPTPITATVSAGTIACNNGSTSLSVTNIAGGTGSGYMISVNGGAFTTTTSYTLAAGTYTITARDANGCTYTVGSATIVNPTPVTLGTPRIQPVTVFGGSNGSITILANGGSSSYTYTLTRPNGTTTTATGGTSSVTFSSLTAGTYTVTVRDANGCGNISRTAIVEQPAQSTLPVKFTSVTAANTNCVVTVNWNVAEELNVSRYDVEISNNGASFRSVSSVSLLNNSGSYTASFAIPSDLKGAMIFVRVNEYDVNGKNTTSQIRTVAGTCGNNANLVIFGYPNPVVSGNSINIAAKEGIFNGKYKLELLDNNGKLYQVKEVQLDNVVSVPFEFTSRIGSGKYLINVTNLNGTHVGTVQFIKLGAN